LDIFI